MTKINELLQELGISKVKLAKYLGVSRQMIYNYLELDDLNKWPKEKKMMLFKLFDISEANKNTLDEIKITPDYIIAVENRLNQGLHNTGDFEYVQDLKKIDKDGQKLFSDLTFLIKDKLSEEYKKNDIMTTLTYVYHILQALDNIEEIKYFLAYMSKVSGFTDPKEFKYNENKQFVFEGIVHSAITLYGSGQASKQKVAQSHARFVKEIEQKREEQLSRTQELIALTKQALKELNYTDFKNENAVEVYAKMNEIEARNN